VPGSPEEDARRISNGRRDQTARRGYASAHDGGSKTRAVPSSRANEPPGCGSRWWSRPSSASLPGSARGMRSLRHVFLALRLRRPDTHGRGGHVHGQRPGERSTDHAAGLEEPTHRQGAGNGQLPAAATLTSSSASTCSARPRTPPMAPPCHLPGYLTATVCALSSGLSRSVAAAASVDTIRSVPPPRPYLVS
jgi:hypothetical protein